MTLLMFLVCLFASGIGAVCGIGGGVIIKPVLDSFQILGLGQVNFLSGCTVLCMSAYSVLSAAGKPQTPLDTARILPLSLGAALGGLGGKLLFQAVADGMAGAVRLQALCLLLLLLGTLLYTLFEKRIPTRNLHNKGLSALVGLFLGFFSSFLGIGGGPFNLVVLSFCFSMDTKTAARHSLFIILISQAASLLYTLLSGSAPNVPWLYLLVMAAGGIGGGILGRLANKRLGNDSIRRLFLGLTLVIIGICVYNIIRV